MAEGARLESACTGNRTGGSTPPLSAQLRPAPAPREGRGFFMAPAIELVPVSQGAIKTQRCAKGAPRALDEIEVPTQGNPPALRARRNPPLSARIKKPAAFAAGFFVNDRVELARTWEVAKKPDGAPALAGFLF